MAALGKEREAGVGHKQPVWQSDCWGVLLTISPDLLPDEASNLQTVPAKLCLISALNTTYVKRQEPRGVLSQVGVFRMKSG